MDTTVLVVGGTGRTGRLLVTQLLARGVRVRAIVRAAERLPEAARRDPRLGAIEADLVAMPDAELAEHVRGCDAMLSCLGHTISLAGVFGPPHDLVTRTVARLARAAEAVRAAAPVRLVLMSSVSVDHPLGGDAPRTAAERALLRVLFALVPPVRDNQRAADHLCREVGAAHPAVQWVIVRPDSLVAGEAGSYVLDESLAISLFRPESTSMANVAHFMCELVTRPDLWEAWRGKLPVIVNAPATTPVEARLAPAAS